MTKTAKSSLKSILARVKEARKQIDQVKKELKKDGKQLLMKEAFEAIFEQHPNVVEFKWDQYTPSWNDGEPCYFSANEVHVKFKGAEEEGGEMEDGYYSSFDIKWAREKGELTMTVEEAVDITAALDEMSEILEALGEDMMQELFGDPAEVYISRRGIQVEEIDPPY